MGKGHRVTTEIILSPAPELQPAPLFTPTPKAAKRVLEFFTAQVNNDNTARHISTPCAALQNGATVAASSSPAGV